MMVVDSVGSSFPFILYCTYSNIDIIRTAEMRYIPIYLDESHSFQGFIIIIIIIIILFPASFTGIGHLKMI